VGCTSVCVHVHEDIYVHASKERILPYIKDIASEVREGISGPKVIWTWHFKALTFALLAILPIYDKYVCTPYLQTLQRCIVVIKTAA